MEIASIIFFIMVVPLALALVIPRLWLALCTLLVLLAFTVLWVDEQRMQCASCGGPFSGLGLAILAVAVVGFLIGIAIRAVIAFFKPAGKVAPREAHAANLITWALVSATLAVLATGLAVVLLNRWFDSGWGTHLGICLLALAWFFRTPFFWPKGSEAEPVQRSLLRPGSVFGWVGTVAMFFLLAWSVRAAGVTQEAAELAASGRPYCLTTSSEKGLRPARTSWDLSGFSMQADRGSVRHAALVTGDVGAPEWLYWSYRRGAFEPDFMRWPMTCELRPGFAKDLPAIWPVVGSDTGANFKLVREILSSPVESRETGVASPKLVDIFKTNQLKGPL